MVGLASWRLDVLHGGWVLILWCAAMPSAKAGAWTLGERQGQIYAEVDYSWATRQFSNHEPVTFEKVYVKDLYEYAWSDSLTLFSEPQFVAATIHRPNEEYSARDFAFDAGARVRLADKPYGVFSLQSSFAVSSPYTVTSSQGSAVGGQVEVRGLYGLSFRVWQFDSFLDVETAWRWTPAPRPNEFQIDTAFGAWLTTGTLFMLQTFNTYSAGFQAPPYTAYRLNKCEASLVRRLFPGVSIQLGGMMAISGRRVVAERGVAVSVWIST